jgi:flagellar hook protein FlgE
MLRSLFSAISGLRANQTMLDVTGNNIANANTVGFKSSNIVFQDTLSQMLTGGSAGVAGAGNPGGTNPIQVGLGVQVGGITTSFNQGSAQTTGRPTNLMISGDGFFMVKRGNESLYTRAGAFHFDDLGNLVTPDGDKVQGYLLDGTTSNKTGSPVDITIDEMTGAKNATNPGWGDLKSYSIGADGTISGVYSDGKTHTLYRVALANFSNPEGLEKVGDTAFRQSAASGAAQVDVPGAGRLGSLQAGSLEMSNVDLAQEFTNLIIAQRGFQATSRVITTSDQVLEDLVNIKR